jgi:hypothetical protein
MNPLEIEDLPKKVGTRCYVVTTYGHAEQRSTLLKEVE